MRRLFLAILLVIAGASGAVAQTTPGWVGAYIWGGLIATRSPASAGAAQFHDSVRFMLDQGFDTIRFTVSPSAMPSYNLPSDRYCVRDKRIGCFARLMLDSDAWDHPGLRRIMVTAIDYTCFIAGGNNAGGCLDPARLAANEAAIRAEHMDLMAAFRDRFAGRRIQVIFSNWEGDNFTFCSSFNFATRANFAADCVARWPQGQNSLQRGDAFLRWWSIRDAALTQFLSANRGLDYVNAPEVNGWFDTFDRGCNGYCDPNAELLSRIAAHGGRDWCSYSSYGSQGPRYLDELREILRRSCRNLIIGEGGLHRPTHSDAAIAENFRRMNEARSLALPDGRRVAGVVPWIAIDPAELPRRPNGVTMSYGLFDQMGREVLAPLMGPLRPMPVAAARRR